MNIVKGFVERVGRTCSAVATLLLHFRFVFILSVVVALAQLTFARARGSGVTVVLIVINNVFVVFRRGQGRCLLRCGALDVARQT